MIITEDFLNKGLAGRGVISYLQATCLNISYPLRKGWKTRAIGIEVPEERAIDFIKFAKVKPQKKERSKIIRKLKNQSFYEPWEPKKENLSRLFLKAKEYPNYSWIISRDFLLSYQWRKLRMEALKMYKGSCNCCGRSREDDAILNVDHIKPRRFFPELALDINNLQVLCEMCNHGKGNWDSTDWRPQEKKC